MFLLAGIFLNASSRWEFVSQARSRQTFSFFLRLRFAESYFHALGKRRESDSFFVSNSPLFLSTVSDHLALVQRLKQKTSMNVNSYSKWTWANTFFFFLSVSMFCLHFLVDKMWLSFSCQHSCERGIALCLSFSYLFIYWLIDWFIELF